MARAKFTQLALALLAALSGCGLKIDQSSSRHSALPCGNTTNKTFPNSREWSSDLLSALLQCSQKSEHPLVAEPHSLRETAHWLNHSFDSQSREQLIRFLQAVPAELGHTLKIFARSTSPLDQKHWPEWIRWTQIVISNPALRPEILVEQLQILSQVPADSLNALISMLEKLREATPEKRIQVLERLTKIYVDFSQTPNLQLFLNHGVTPLNCLKLEAVGHTDNSLISSGWSLLLRSQNHPIKFARTFAQSYGLLQNFCSASQIPSPTATHAALEYFMANHEQVFLPILKVTDQSSRALIPLLRLWSQSQVHFNQIEFASLLDALHKILSNARDSTPRALSTYVQMLAKWANSQNPEQIYLNIERFKKIPWDSFVVPAKVLNEWSTGSEKSQTTFLYSLAEYIEQNSHRKMANLLSVIKVRTPRSQALVTSPITATQINSVENRLLTFASNNTSKPLPVDAHFLKCLRSNTPFLLWTCLSDNKQPVPFFDDFMSQEKLAPLFFEMSNPEQPGRWLGQGFFSASALPRWTQALKSLQGLTLPIQHFIKTFPLADMINDDKIKQTYQWFRSTPQHQPESPQIRSELGITTRLSQSDFENPVWLNWFADPSKWVAVQKVLTDPHRSLNIITGLKNLTKRRLRLRLYQSDAKGLGLTSKSELGMLSVLDILLWEVPYDWTRKWIISRILNATSPSDLRHVLNDSQSLLAQGLWALDVNPITRHGKLWKKASNANAILNATISMGIEMELFNWCEVMKALAAGLPSDQAEDFLVTLQKTGIISSISHFLHEQNPTPAQFAASLIEVFHVIRSSKATWFAWHNAVSENQASHGLFVYQILTMAAQALDSPDKFYHLKQMSSLVRTGALWVEREKRMLPLKKVLDAITGPETVLNPWIWIFLREIQDRRSTYHGPWIRLMQSLENPRARQNVEAWIDSKIPEDIGSWMDAIVTLPATRQF